MKTIVNNVALSVVANSDVANLPEFNVIFLNQGMLMGHCVHADTFDSNNNVASAYITSVYDSGMTKYGSYHIDRSGNPGYGGNFYVGAGECGESPLVGRNYKFESGWSSRVNVMNDLFGTTLTEATHGKGIDIFNLIGIINEQYEGKVYLSFNITDSDIDYSINPYDEDNVSKFEKQGADHYRNREHYEDTILDVQSESFYDDAVRFFNDCREMNGIISGETCNHFSAYKWSDDDEHQVLIGRIDAERIKTESEMYDDDRSEEAAYYDGRDDWEDEQEYLDWEEGQHEHELFMLTFCGPMLQQDLEEIASGDYCCLLTMQEHNVIPF